MTSKYESCFLSLILEAILCMVFEANGPISAVFEMIKRSGFLDFDYSLLVFQLLDGLMIFVGIRCASSLTFSIRTRRFHIKQRSLAT